MSRKVYIETFGCQMNEVDSARMISLLGSADYEQASDPDEADLVLLNTCSIREKADQKIYSALGELRKWKASRAGRLLAVGGCLAQQAGATLAARAPYVDVVFGTHNISRLPDLLSKARGASDPVIETCITNDVSHWDVQPYLAAGAASAMVTIMQGCDNYCAYCVVPLVRGPEISRPARDIIAEVRSLSERGVREVILLGQNVNSFGRKEGEMTFPDLIRRIAAVDGIRRIRFVTSHPRDLDGGTIALFSEIESICPSIHLPVQSGSDRILEAMGRGYTRREYLAKVAALSAARPGIAFSSDFIVGFPGESDDDFEGTLSVMEEVTYDSAFSFRFSPRPGTRAFGMGERVDPGRARERLSRLQAMQDSHTRKRLEYFVGRETEVLVEGPSARSREEQCGRTPCGKMVNFRQSPGSQGPIRRVRIVSAGAHSLSGVEGDAGG